MADIAGINVQVQIESGNPTTGKPVNLQVTAPTPETQSAAFSLAGEAEDRRDPMIFLAAPSRPRTG